MDMIKKNWLTL